MRPISALVIVCSLFLTLCYISVAGTRDPNISDQKYIKYAEDFNYVGKLCGKTSKGTLFCGSAVAINDHFMITAAHVVQDVVSCELEINNNKFCITQICIHKNFEKEFGIGDIAVGYSEKPFKLSFYPPLYEDTDEVNKVCSIAGYGITGTFNTGAVISDSRRRAGSNYIINTHKDLLICDASWPKDKTRTELEFLIASGDSGGGLFIGDKLAGINSCVISSKTPKSGYGEESGHTRISKFIPWILEYQDSIKKELDTTQP